MDGMNNRLETSENWVFETGDDLQISNVKDKFSKRFQKSFKKIKNI